MAEVEARYVAANPKSKARFEAVTWDMPGGNTRTVMHYDPFPVALVKGEGAYLTDLDGHTYIDFLGEFMAGLFGRSEPSILRAIQVALIGGLVLGGPKRRIQAVLRRFGVAQRQYGVADLLRSIVAIRIQGFQLIRVLAHLFEQGVVRLLENNAELQGLSYLPSLPSIARRA